MKKFSYSLLLSALILCLILAACGKTESPEGPGTGPGSSATSPTAAPTPTPTPVPTPIPYERLSDESAPVYSFASDYAQVSVALLEAEEPVSDAWMEQFSSVGIAAPQYLEVSRLLDSAGMGDIMAHSDDCLFILDNKELVILSLNGEEDAVLSRTAVGIDWTGGESDNGTNVSGYEKMPLALFCLGDRIAVVSDWYSYNGSAQAITYMEYTSVDFFSVADLHSPAFLASYGQDGIYKSSRLTGNGDLTILTGFTPSHTDAQRPDGLVPAVYTGGSRTPLTPGKILLTEDAAEKTAAFSVLGSYSLSASAQSDVIAIPGMDTGDIALEEDGAHFIRRRWASGPSRELTENGAEVHEYAVTACTDVFCLHGENGALTVESITAVNGWLSGASAFDIQNGQLWYASSLCQGLYTQDAQGGVLWRETETGTRLGSRDLSTGASAALNLPENEGHIRWAGLLNGSAAYTTESGQTFVYRDDQTQAVEVPLEECTILPWGEWGYMVFSRVDGNTIMLSVRDTSLREAAVRSFGSDHSNTLTNQASYFSDAEADLLGFAADDSYCLYGFTAEEGFRFRADAFLTDWAWNARAMRIGGCLAIADTEEVFLYDISTMKLLQTFALDA